ncbi:hypothetical protein [Emticicia agri]|uniref:Uncharacterized protein n=1 Tax=Emticicia agri TaxID=2492393 RepID=A0A4Q5LP52_9BACT|nr:hypothetical protein [Emticicia agri]RYU91059.1 hypothetical protein EWM59_27055 [Emticicia agri]
MEKFIPYQTLLQEKKEKGEIIYYIDLLLTFEWRNKRDTIIARDKKRCTSCKNEATILDRFGKAFRPPTKEEKREYIDGFLKEMNVKETKSINGADFYNFYKDLYFPVEIPFDEFIFLHVHHTYYIIDKLPWDYPQDALITLCHKFHKEIHLNNQIPVYLDDDKSESIKLTVCNKCNGSGYIPEYNYYMNGICFDCNGYKYNELVIR